MMNHKGFSISAFEDRPGIFKAAISGAEGQHVRATANGLISDYMPGVTTLEYASAESAIAEAKKVIDARGVELQPQPDPRAKLKGGLGAMK